MSTDKQLEKQSTGRGIIFHAISAFFLAAIGSVSGSILLQVYQSNPVLSATTGVLLFIIIMFILSLSTTNSEYSE